MLFDTPTTLTAALRHQAMKQVLALSPDIGAHDMQEFLPAQIRERSFFSARTPYAGYLADVQSWIQNLVQPDVRLGPDGLVKTVAGESLSPAQVRAKMKRQLQALGYAPDADKKGGLQDLSSDRRVNLIIDTQLKMSRGYGSWRQSQGSTILDLWPADELYRAMRRQTVRDWQTRWNEARANLGDSTTATEATSPAGPFVARKNDPIWVEISSFGNPYPPFDYGSGMYVRGVNRRRAIELRVIDPDDHVKPVLDPLNRPWSVALQDTTSGIASALQQAFGERASLQGNALHILPDPRGTLEELIYRATKGDQASGAFAFVPENLQGSLTKIINRPVKPGATFEIDAAHIRHNFNVHGFETERRRGQIPIRLEDVRNLPEIVKTGVAHKTTAAELNAHGPSDVTLECADGYVVGATYGGQHNRLLVKSVYRRAAK